MLGISIIGSWGPTNPSVETNVSRFSDDKLGPHLADPEVWLRWHQIKTGRFKLNREQRRLLNKINKNKKKTSGDQESIYAYKTDVTRQCHSTEHLI